MTAVLQFEEEHVYGPQHVAAVPVTFHPNSGSFTISAFLDTGAWTSVFNRSIAPRLGISDITTGEPVELQLPNGSVAVGYAHLVPIEFLGHRLTVPIAFCPDFPTNSPNLLGMRGFFEQLRIAFEHGSRKVYA